MRMRGLVAVFCLAVGSALPLHAQRTDSARAGVSAPVPTRAPDTAESVGRDSLTARPPISPGHAFLESALVPGWGQATLHRSTAGTIFTVVEAMSVAMLIQSKKELAEARRFGADSIVDHYDPPPQPGGTPTPVYAPNQFTARIKPRKQAVEDWTFLLIFNHLIAGADAFVAAHLWDVPIEVSARSGNRSAAFLVRIPW